MNEVRDVPWMSAQFFFRLGLGYTLLFPWIPISTLGKSFHRWSWLLSVVCLGLSGVWLEFSRFWIFFGVFWTAGALFASFAFGDGQRWRRLVFILERVLVVALLGVAWFVFQKNSWRAGMDAATAAFCLGTATLALMVGHWYLVAPGISFGLLSTWTLLTCFALVLRSGWLGWSTFELYDDLGEELWQDVFWWGRVALGVFLPFIFSLMAFRTLKYKNNQAATGILYVLVVLLVMGELVHLGWWPLWLS